MHNEWEFLYKLYTVLLQCTMNSLPEHPYPIPTSKMSCTLWSWSIRSVSADMQISWPPITVSVFQLLIKLLYSTVMLNSLCTLQTTIHTKQFLFVCDPQLNLGNFEKFSCSGLCWASCGKTCSPFHLSIYLSIERNS